jgi:hypothetical protein
MLVGNIQNPLIIDAKGKKWDDLEDPFFSTQHVVGTLDRNKYDGVIFNNIKDSWIDDVDYQDPSTVYVTFKPEQIKSAEYNNGKFSKNSPDINESNT